MGSEPYPVPGPDGRPQRWRCAVSLGQGPDGKARRRTLSGKTKSEVLAKRTELLSQLAAGERPAAKYCTFNDLLDSWLRYKREEAKAGSRSVLTVEGYERIATLYIRPRLGKVRVNGLNPERVQRHLLALKTELGLGNKTVKNVHAALRACLNHGARWRIISKTDADIGHCPVSGNDSAPAQVFDRSQAQQFLEVVRGHRYEALFLTALFTGMRPEELYGLTWTHVRDEHIEVRQVLQYHAGVPVLVDHMKTAKSRRDIPVPALVIRKLHELRASRAGGALKVSTPWVERGLVFLSGNGMPMNPSNVNKQLKQLLSTHGLPPLSPYDLRHSYATIALVLGVDRHVVMDMMGHTTPGMTMHYETIVKELRDDAARAMAAAFSQ